MPLFLASGLLGCRGAPLGCCLCRSLRARWLPGSATALAGCARILRGDLRRLLLARRAASALAWRTLGGLLRDGLDADALRRRLVARRTVRDVFRGFCCGRP